MAEAKRPLPKLDEPDTGPFWAATAQQRLTYPRCRSCGQVVFYPRRHCNACLSTDLEWLQASGSGTVYTFSVVRQSYHPFFRALVPYAVGWIDLDEGCPTWWAIRTRCVSVSASRSAGSSTTDCRSRCSNRPERRQVVRCALGSAVSRWAGGCGRCRTRAFPPRR